MITALLVVMTAVITWRCATRYERFQHIVCDWEARERSLTVHTIVEYVVAKDMRRRLVKAAGKLQQSVIEYHKLNPAETDDAYWDMQVDEDALHEARTEICDIDRAFEEFWRYKFWMPRKVYFALYPRS